MPLNDQFEMGRIPLKPLPYKNRDLAQCNEFLIDYGKDASYHMYIVDSNDDTIYIDLTSKILEEFYHATVNGDNFKITIEGITDPQTLRDLLNFIYKRFTYPDNPNGFDPATDKYKIYLPTTKSVLLRDTSGTIYLPITTADNVYDSSGKTIQERLDNMTRLGFSNDYVWAETNNQTVFEFNYPFPNYPNGGNYLEIRIGTTYIDKTRYRIIDNVNDNGDIVSGTLVLLSESVEINRRVDFLFIFNTISATDGELQAMSGGQIANNSIPTSKLERVTTSYTLDDPSCVATAKALYDLFSDMSAIITENNDNALWVIDESEDENEIIINGGSRELKDGLLISVVLTTRKLPATTIVKYYKDGNNVAGTLLKDVTGAPITTGLPKGKTIKFLYKDETFYLITAGIDGIKTNRYIYTCVDQETEIPFNDLNYDIGALIHVYRNGVRLFEDLDYFMDSANEKITLYVRTEEGERIVFEALYV